MAKNRHTKKQGAKPMAPEENGLPRNIQLVGERDVEEDKSIYIAQSVYRAIHKFAAGKTKVESGGMLVGSVVREFGKTNIIISGFVEAKFCQATASTLTFTHATWERCYKDIASQYPGQKITGWIHTHPGFGIFLSEYDKFIQENFFKEEDQIAYVIDPTQNTEGFYVWKNEKIEKSKGFFIFDKTGTPIDAAAGEPRPAAGGEGGRRGGWIAAIAVLILLGIAFIITAIYASNLGSKLDKLQQQQQLILNGVNQNLNYLQSRLTTLENEIEQRITTLENEIEQLKAGALAGSEKE